MKFFARINNEQHGPYTLRELVEAGVTPQTYVWCKGMEDWEQASQVPDICRYFRQRLSGTLPTAEEESRPGEVIKNNPSGGEPTLMERVANGEKVSFSEIYREANRQYREMEENGIDYSRPPQTSMTLAIVSTIICCPPTGIAAIYFTNKARRFWKEAAGNEEMQREAHDAARQARMWTGISLSLGIILYAALAHFA